MKKLVVCICIFGLCLNLFCNVKGYELASAGTSGAGHDIGGFATSASWSVGAASESVSSANHSTAIRCLNLAETCLMGGDWENALKQSNLGLSYDNSISDLYYIKAAAEIKMGKTKAYILDLVKQGFEKDNWVGYTKNGARILYADLLSDVGLYDQSMSILDQDPFILSADAEFIRIKNLYRMGTTKSLNDARLKVNSSRRIYPNDNRFPNIFFMFELMFVNEGARTGVNYEIPEIVKSIANSYLAKLPDYSEKDPSVELMATFFAEPEEQNRLIRAIDAKTADKNCLLAFAGMKNGLYTEDQAFQLFFSAANDILHLGILENFAMSLTDENVKTKFVEKFVNFQGTILIDSDYDLQAEIAIEYKLGRPSSVKYDFNNDGELEVYATCDFGVPNYIYFGENNSEVRYSSYPYVSNISFKGKDFLFNFLDADYIIKPMEFIVDNLFSSFNLDFYIPLISTDIVIPDIDELTLHAINVELPTAERANSKVIYYTFEGSPMYCEFYDNDIKYALCDFSKGYPFTRYVDNDYDSYFETHEIFNISESDSDFITEEEIAFVESIFNPVALDKNTYLQKVKIDTNGNTFFEFTEEYLGLGGKITIWDSDDNGIPNSQYIKYPQEQGAPLKEDSIFFDDNGNPYIIINFLGGIPVKMNYGNSEVIVSAGNNNNFYWIEENGNEVTGSDLESKIMKDIVPQLSNGVIDIISEGDFRFSVIKVNDKVFCRLLPESQVLIEEDLSELVTDELPALSSMES